MILTNSAEQLQDIQNILQDLRILNLNEHNYSLSDLKRRANFFKNTVLIHGERVFVLPMSMKSKIFGHIDVYPEHISSKQTQEILDNTPDYELAKLTPIKHLCVIESEFEDLPDELDNLNELQLLDIEGSLMRPIVPSVISNLTSLISLNIANNKLHSIPPELFQLPNLEYLDLSRNQLTAIPTEIQQLTRLKKLDISSNNLDDSTIDSIKALLPTDCSIME